MLAFQTSLSSPSHTGRLPKIAQHRNYIIIKAFGESLRIYPSIQYKNGAWGGIYTCYRQQARRGLQSDVHKALDTILEHSKLVLPQMLSTLEFLRSPGI